MITATLGNYYAAEFCQYPGSVKTALEKAVGIQAVDNMKWSYGLQKVMSCNERNVYMFFGKTMPK